MTLHRAYGVFHVGILACFGCFFFFVILIVFIYKLSCGSDIVCIEIKQKKEQTIVLYFCTVLKKMSDISSLKAILSELDQLFDREDDINDLFDVSKMRREITTNSQQNTRDAKELIKGKCFFIDGEDLA